MSFNYRMSSKSGYDSSSNYFFRCIHHSSSDQNIESRKDDNELRSYNQHSSIKKNDENNSMRKVKTCEELSLNLEEIEKCTTVADSVFQIKDQYSTPKQIAAKLIALADAFDKEYFGNLNISTK